MATSIFAAHHASRTTDTEDEDMDTDALTHRFTSFNLSGAKEPVPSSSLSTSPASTTSMRTDSQSEIPQSHSHPPFQAQSQSQSQPLPTSSPSEQYSRPRPDEYRQSHSYSPSHTLSQFHPPAQDANASYIHLTAPSMLGLGYAPSNVPMTYAHSLTFASVHYTPNAHRAALYEAQAQAHAEPYVRSGYAQQDGGDGMDVDS